MFYRVFIVLFSWDQVSEGRGISRMSGGGISEACPLKTPWKHSKTDREEEEE
jgi:hypothetical protein